MKYRAIILYGPSGVGKTRVAAFLSEKYGFKHADTDSFMLLFSPKRSRERSEIGQKLCYTYASELVKRGLPVIIEALGPRYLNLLQKKLRANNYAIDEISLDAPLAFCIKNDRYRNKRDLGARVVKKVYEKYRSTKGYCFDTSKKKPQSLLREIEKVLRL